MILEKVRRPGQFSREWIRSKQVMTMAPIITLISLLKSTLETTGRDTVSL